jgi:tetratricopeptide (TPR) repeat protein
MSRTRGHAGSLLIGLSLAVVCALPTVVHAEPEKPQEADRLFSEGRKALAANDSQRACELFEEAIKLDVTATGTMLNLGLCYENLKKYATSLYWFRKAQSSAAESRLEDYESAAKEHTVSISPKVSIVTLTITNGDDAEVRVDGKKIERTDYGKVEVDAGSHEFVVTAPDKARESMTVEIAEAENKPVSFTLRNLVLIDRGKRRRRVGMITAGAGGAVMLASLIYNLERKSAWSDLPATDAMRNEIRDQVRYVGTTIFSVGLAAAVVGTVLYFTAAGTERVAEGTAIAPMVSQDSVGLAVGGRF